jgi:hypothetical protein
LNSVSADGSANNSGFAYQSSSAVGVTEEVSPQFCALDDPECEACQ